MRKIVLLATLIACFASVGLAQEKSKVEVFGGFSVNSIDTGLGDSGLLNADDRETAYGFETSVTGFFNDKFGIEGNVDGHYKTKDFAFGSCQAIGCPAPGTFETKISTYNFTAGPHVRFATENSKVTPFLHALAGGNHSRVRVNFSNTTFNDDETDFALKLGGGVDFGLSKRLDLRLAADYNPVFEREAGDNRTRHDGVFSIGLVFK
ncbi:MAG TPA: outer membrane beta-barrel protein [Pyrinomonadaceae bacterium]|jgi:opacity protein-like surface antigen